MVESDKSEATGGVQREAPLAGIKVLEVGVAMAGPFCGMTLGDYGADVVKIERIGEGDESRSWLNDPDFDGLSAPRGLPEIEPIRGLSLLNGGVEIVFFRYARHGETVAQQSRYASITEKETSKGPIILVVIESEYRNGDGELLIKARRTHIRR